MHTYTFVGFYKMKIEKQVKVFDAYDNDPSVEARTKGFVKNIDMSIPLLTAPFYDWLLCLDILKFMPPTFEDFDITLFNMAKLANKGLVISWPPPDEQIYQKLNEKIGAHVENIFRSFCFIKDKNLTTYIRQYSFDQTIRANIIIFLRTYPCTFEYI